jgi:nucleoside-diphosphate-sugar epimerase
MRVFVTGGSGFVGSAIVAELLGADHSVVGLARSDQTAAQLEAAGAEAHAGSLEDLDSLKAGAANSDGVIHTAFDNSDLAHFAASSATERAALRAMGMALAGTNRPLVFTSGFGSVTPGRIATEADRGSQNAAATGRNSEERMAELLDDGVNASIVRLPCVHGPGDRFTVPAYVDIARRAGQSVFVGDGTNRWAAVHSHDAARAYRLALEAGVPDRRYHAVAEEGVPFKSIAEIIGRQLGIPLVSKSRSEAIVHLGAYASFAESDLPASSLLTQEWLGWQPHDIGLLADIDRSDYFSDQPRGR